MCLVVSPERTQHSSVAVSDELLDKSAISETRERMLTSGLGPSWNRGSHHAPRIAGVRSRSGVRYGASMQRYGRRLLRLCKRAANKTSRQGRRSLTLTSRPLAWKTKAPNPG
jgi:hypothetical protein